MTFKIFGTAVNNAYKKFKGALVNVDLDINSIYLAAFPEGTNPIYKTHTEHDCSCCKQFLRNVGTVVALNSLDPIKDGKVKTLWGDLKNLPHPYDVVAQKLHEAVSKAAEAGQIASVFSPSEPLYGAETTKQLQPDGHAHTWHHFWADTSSHQNKHQKGAYKEKVDLLKRSLETLKPENVETVLALIDQNMLYRGEEHKSAVQNWQKVAKAYAASANKTLFLWENATNSAVYFKNSVIGTLVEELNDKPLEGAVASFESKVAPTNYRRPKALVTKQQIKSATQTLKQLGLQDALHRRHATLADVPLKDVIWASSDAKKVMNASPLDALLAEVKPKTEGSTISWSDLKTLLPSATALRIKLAHPKNLVSLTAPAHADSGRLFKWDSPLAWSYRGGVADAIQERVTKAGGQVKALMRFSLAWHNHDDLDLHLDMPGSTIYYANKKTPYAELDVDANSPSSTKTRTPVENIVINTLLDGNYDVYVKNCQKREFNDGGFTLQVAQGEVAKDFTFAASPGDNCSKLVYSFFVRGGKLVDEQHSEDASTEPVVQSVWGVETGGFIPVDTVTYSPNVWDDKEGHRHVFFLSRKVQNDEQCRGFYNEFLRTELAEHGRVFETLGGKTYVEQSAAQLSGLGFSSTTKEVAVVELTTEKGVRTYTVQF